MECLINAGTERDVSVRGNFYMNHLLKKKKRNEQNSTKGDTFRSCLGGLQELVRVCANDMGEASSGRLFGGGNPTDTPTSFTTLPALPEPQSI